MRVYKTDSDVLLKPLTKGERFSHYKAAFENMEEASFASFCRYLPYDLTKENYPELWKFKPRWVKVTLFGSFKNPLLGGTGYWFKSKRVLLRRLILKWIIMRMS